MRPVRKLDGSYYAVSLNDETLSISGPFGIVSAREYGSPIAHTDNGRIRYWRAFVASEQERPLSESDLFQCNHDSLQSLHVLATVSPVTHRNREATVRGWLG